MLIFVLPFVIVALIQPPDNLKLCEAQAKEKASENYKTEPLYYEQCILKISIANLKNFKTTKPETIAQYEQELIAVEQKIQSEQTISVP